MSEINQPLVSVIIYNYNHGCFISQCLESVFAQSYQNIEVLFSDNSSTDNSWEIALSFSKKYPDKMFVARNHTNYGPKANLNNCITQVRGKYFVMVGADDTLYPNYIQEAVTHLEKNLDAAFLIAHHSVINNNQEVIEIAPFYNQSCIIPAPKQAAVHMMTSINPTITQIVYRNSFVNQILSSGSGIRFQGIRIIDFELACKHSVIYLSTPLVFHRHHDSNDASYTTEKLMDVLSAYVMNFDFEDKAKSLGLTEVSDRLTPSIEKNAKNALRYCLHFLRMNNRLLAKRYFYLSFALYPDIESDSLFQSLKQLWDNPSINEESLVKLIANHPPLQRNFSYEPPQGFMALN